ncbi:hypothetical protein [Jannaschia helgolandensis]|uniref:hypothetical protein n=1 Tax=Jannaschia helgolandensis TaxID=188906 RepID=UPI0030DDC500|tara:strand:- start:230 stop:433 length:204 start_codon:yes stop_codon:yes gene_type:complete
MTKDPRSPNHDPTSAPMAETGKESVVSGDIPNETLHETRPSPFISGRNATQRFCWSRVFWSSASAAS